MQSQPHATLCNLVMPTTVTQQPFTLRAQFLSPCIGLRLTPCRVALPGFARHFPLDFNLIRAGSAARVKSGDAEAPTVPEARLKATAILTVRCSPIEHTAAL